jgi:TonB-linked SusC/RagA family outer membrane protein
MKKLLLVSLCFLMLCVTQVYAQNRTITGTVTAKDDGLPMPGVSVKVKGTTVGTQTNTQGKYTLSVPAGATTLIFTFIGYTPFERPISSGDVKMSSSGKQLDQVNVTLSASSKQLGEVQVTGALGVRRQAKELGYAATNITAGVLTEAHPTNFTNGLTAKAPGLVISTVNNGLNPDTRFTLRGNRHITGNNFALVVLNGVPISPNEVNAINPDDIESVNILNGAGAAALYGSEASNGALVITTKRGTPGGAPVVTYSNTYQLESISYFPALQTTFGGYGGEGPPFQDPVTGFITGITPFENQSYGPAYTGQLATLGIPLQDGTLQKYPYSTPKEDPRRAFFQTGHSEQNSVSYAAGDASNSFNFSANRLDKTDIVPMDSYNRTQLRLSGSKTAGILKLDATASFSQDNTNKYGNYGDVLGTLFNTPSWVPLENFKDVTKPFADPSTYFNSYGINPYWSLKNSRTLARSDIFNGSFQATLTPTKWFDATYRLADNEGTYQEQDRRAEIDYTPYALSDPTSYYGASYGTVGKSYGTAITPGTVNNFKLFGDGNSIIGPGGPQGYSRIQQDMIVNFHKTFFNDFKTNLLLGNTIWQEYANAISNGTNNLLINNFYNVGYLLGTPNAAQSEYKIRQIAYFGDLSIGYKDYLFLDATLRNDHDSRLAPQFRSFWYPSVKGSFIFTQAIDALKNNSVLSYGKLRASYSKTGDVNVNPYSTVNTYGAISGFPYGNIGGLGLSQQLNNPGLKPELSNEVEFGTDLGFFNGRVNLTATYYNTHTKNQTLPIGTSPATGYTSTILNIGETQNQGEEFKLDVQVLQKSQSGVGLNLGGNFSIQNSKVLSLFGQTTQVPIGGYTTATTEAAVGKPYPALYVTDILRDPQGHAIVDPTTGYPQQNPNLVYAGQTTPKYLLGLTQTVSWKFMTLSLTEEYRTGYVIYNGSLQSATGAGVSLYSTSSNRQRFIFPNSVINTGTASNPVYTPNNSISVQDGSLGFWDNNAFYSSASSYVESGAFWKLREADLEFNLTNWVKKSKFIKKATFALNGRNLLMWRPKTNNFTDPEFANSNLNGDLGVTSTAQLPPTRIYGGNLTITF